MKFDEYKPVTDCDGFQFAKEGEIMIGDKYTTCLICKAPTKYIEIFTEAHFCSDECVDKFYEWYNREMKKIESLEED